MRDVVSSIELGKSHGPYRLHHAQEVSSLPHPSHAAVAAYYAAVTAADFGDSVSTVSGVSGVAGASGVAGVSGVPGVSAGTPQTRHPPWHIGLGHLNCIGGCIAGDGALQMMASQNFTSCHQSKPL